MPRRNKNAADEFNRTADAAEFRKNERGTSQDQQEYLGRAAIRNRRAGAVASQNGGSKKKRRGY